MNDEQIYFISIRIMAFLVFIAFSFFVRIVVIESYNLDGVCEEVYGENYIHDTKQDFGSLCVKLNYSDFTKVNPKPLKFSHKEMREICGLPKFFELNKWGNYNC